MHMARRNRPATTAHKPHCIPVVLSRLESDPPLALQRVRDPREPLSRAWVASFAYPSLCTLFLFKSSSSSSWNPLFLLFSFSSHIVTSLSSTRIFVFLTFVELANAYRDYFISIIRTLNNTTSILYITWMTALMERTLKGKPEIE